MIIVFSEATTSIVVLHETLTFVVTAVKISNFYIFNLLVCHTALGGSCDVSVQHIGSIFKGPPVHDPHIAVYNCC